MFDFLKTNKTPDNLQTLQKDLQRLFITQNIIKEISRKNTLEEIAKVILNQIEKEMGYSAASISLVNNKTKTIQLKYLSDSTLSKISEKIIMGANAFREIPLQEEPVTLTKKAAIEGNIIIDTDISKFISPPLPVTIAKTIQVLGGIKSMIAMPIKAREGVIAILNFSMDRLKEEMSANELKTLELLVDQIGLIIDNIFKYEEINTFNSQLKVEVESATTDLRKQNEDLQSLYNLTSQVSKSLDISTVAQTAVNSLPQDKIIVGSILAEHNKEGNVLENIALTENALYFQVTKIIQDPKQYKLSLDDEGSQFNLAVKAFKQGVPQFTNSLKDFLAPTLPGPLISAVEGVLKIKSVGSYPLIVRGQVIGTLTFLIKDKTAEELSESEKQLLGTYTYHITIALENAELYKQQKETQANLEKALMEVQALRQHEQDMIDIMGHELRTPISIVRNALGMLEMELKNTGAIKPDNLGKFLDISMESARREVKLVETLLSSAKADSRGFQLLFEKVDFVDVVNDSLEFFTREAEKKGLQIRYTKPTEEIFVYTDRTRVQEVMDNLLSNSVKYTDKGFIKISVRTEGDYAWIDVNDTGIGMNEKDMKSIGQKFYRVDQYMDSEQTGAEKPNIIRPGGTGLGLYVTFSLIKVMDGKVNVDSKLGVGSTFSFAMPIYKGQESKQEQRKP